MRKTILGAALLAVMLPAHAGVTIISNTADSFSKEDAIKTWKAKGSLQLVENASVSEEFYSSEIGKSASYVSKKISRKVFSGKMKPQEMKNTDSEVIDYIKNNPGSVGYIKSDNLTPDVKEVK